MTHAQVRFPFRSSRSLRPLPTVRRDTMALLVFALVAGGPLVVQAGPMAPAQVISLGFQAAPLDVARLADGTLAAVGTWGKYPALWTLDSSATPERTLLRDGKRLLTGQASRLSSDGAFIAGIQYTRNLRGDVLASGRVWSRADLSAPAVVQPLAGLPRVTSAYAVTTDGSAVGEAGGQQAPIIWSSSAGTTRLLDPLGAATPGAATDVSDDGSVAVGYVTQGGVPQATRWNFSTAQVLETRASQALAVSPAGRFAVGKVLVEQDGFANDVPAIWDGDQLELLTTDIHGSPLVGRALWATDSGIVGGWYTRQDTFQLAGWIKLPGQSPQPFAEWWQTMTGSAFPGYVVSVNAGVEADGQLHLAIAGGRGYHGFVASIGLTAVPEPSGLLLAVLGCCGIGLLARKRRAARSVIRSCRRRASPPAS